MALLKEVSISIIDGMWKSRDQSQGLEGEKHWTRIYIKQKNILSPRFYGIWQVLSVWLFHHCFNNGCLIMGCKALSKRSWWRICFLTGKWYYSVRAGLSGTGYQYHTLRKHDSCVWCRAVFRSWLENCAGDNSGFDICNPDTENDRKIADWRKKYISGTDGGVRYRDYGFIGRFSCY